MKKMILALVALITMTVSAQAMSYEQAKDQALFLTDKMAYELNLTDEQYEAAYEINLDYLMGVNNRNDVFGVYWNQRNLDLQYILLDWQYRAYLDCAYFYRPLYWGDGFWHFRIYARYPHRDYYFFGRPHFYAEYRGGHSWRMNGGRSWYDGRDFAPRGNGGQMMGMKDRFQNGDYGRGTTFGNGRNTRPVQNNVSFGSRRGVASVPQNNRTTFGNNRSQAPARQNNAGTSSFGTRQNSQQNSTRSSTRETVRRNFSNSSAGNSNTNSNSGSFGNRSNSSSRPSSTFSPRMGADSSHSSSSFGGGSRPSGGGFSGGARSGGAASGGGSHFGHR